MKLTIPQKELATALAAVKPAAATSGAIPILANVAIVANERSVTLTATDLDITLRAKAPATVETKGEITVKCSLLHDMVKSVRGENVELYLVKNILHLECGTAHFKLSTLPADDLPPVPRVKEPQEFEIPEWELYQLLSRTAFAHGEDEQRAALCGSLVELNGDFKVITCDGRRLAVDSVEAPEGQEAKGSFIMPAKVVTVLLRLLARGEEGSKTVFGAVGKNLIQFTFGDFTIVSKLVEGQYPPYQKIIPEIPGQGVMLGRMDILDACRRVALVGDGCRLEFRKQTLTILSRATGESLGEAIETLLIPKVEKDVNINLSSRFIIEALDAVDSPEIQILAQSGVPIVLKAPQKNWFTVIASIKEKE